MPIPWWGGEAESGGDTCTVLRDAAEGKRREMTEQSPITPGTEESKGRPPRPGPKPGPPSPAALARKVAPRPAATVDTASSRGSDPSRWGRIDESGAVF